MVESLGNDYITEKISAYIDLALGYINLYDWKSALDILHQGLEAVHGQNRHDLEIPIFNCIGDCFLKRGIAAKSIEYYENALKLADIIVCEDSDNIIESLIGLGAAKVSIYQEKAALQHLTKALKIHTRANHPELLPQIFDQMAIAHLQQGRKQEAYKFLKKAVETARKVNSKRLLCASLLNLGKFYELISNFPMALEIYEEGMMIAKDINYRSIEGKIHLRLGRFHEIYGDLVRARREYTDAFDLLRKTGDRQAILEAMLYLADLSVKLNWIQETEAFYKKIERIARRWHQPDQEMEVCGNLGNLLFRIMRRPKQALYYLQQAVSLATKHNNFVAKSIWRNDIGVLFGELGDYSKAIKCFEKELLFARKIKHLPLELSICTNASAVSYRFGRLQSAYKYSKRAIDLIDKFRKDSPLERHRMSFVGHRMDLFDVAVEVSMRLGKKCKAFQYAEQAKARSLLDLVAMIPFLPTELNRTKSELKQKESEIFLQLRVIQNSDLFDFASRSDTTSMRQVKKYNSLIAELDDVYTNLEKSDPQYVSLRKAGPANYKSIRKALLA